MNTPAVRDKVVKQACESCNLANRTFLWRKARGEVHRCTTKASRVLAFKTRRTRVAIVYRADTHLASRRQRGDDVFFTIYIELLGPPDLNSTPFSRRKYTHQERFWQTRSAALFVRQLTRVAIAPTYVRHRDSGKVVFAGLLRGTFWLLTEALKPRRVYSARVVRSTRALSTRRHPGRIFVALAKSCEHQVGGDCSARSGNSMS